MKPLLAVSFFYLTFNFYNGDKYRQEQRQCLTLAICTHICFCPTHNSNASKIKRERKPRSRQRHFGD